MSVQDYEKTINDLFKAIELYQGEMDTVVPCPVMRHRHWAKIWRAYSDLKDMGGSDASK